MSAAAAARHSRLAVVVAAAAIAAAISSLSCIAPSTTARAPEPASAASVDGAGGAYAATAPGDELTLTVPARIERVTPRVVSLFLESGIPVTSAMGNVVEARLPREVQWVGRYEITARAYVAPLPGGATSVRLLAEETRDASAFGGETRRVSGRSRGRALRVWRGLEQVARRLAAADTAAAPATAAALSAGGAAVR